MKRKEKQTVPESGDGESEILRLQEVADYLHCHYFTVYRLLAKGAIPAFRLGSDWRFRRSDLDKWIDSQTVVTSETKRPPRGPKPKHG
jgi:excisionase family DNA binding protein